MSVRARDPLDRNWNRAPPSDCDGTEFSCGFHSQSYDVRIDSVYRAPGTLGFEVASWDLQAEQFYRVNQ